MCEPPEPADHLARVGMPVTVLALQCQCRCHDGTRVWGAVSGCAGCAVRLCVYENSDGWLVAWGLYGCTLLRGATQLLPFTLILRMCICVIAHPYPRSCIQNVTAPIDPCALELPAQVWGPCQYRCCGGCLPGLFVIPGLSSDMVVLVMHVTLTSVGAYITGRSNLMHADCVFTGWQASDAILQIMHLATVNVSSTLFHDIDSRAELVDVSYGGTAAFENVLFANVTLRTGRVVGTSFNDYQSARFFNEFEGSNDPVGADAFQSCTGVWYHAEDDAEYDVHAEPVMGEEVNALRADFQIQSAIMSDCLFMAPATDFIMPGCPPESRAARRRLLPEACVRAAEALLHRGHAGGSPADAFYAVSHSSRGNADHAAPRACEPQAPPPLPTTAPAAGAPAAASTPHASAVAVPRRRLRMYARKITTSVPESLPAGNGAGASHGDGTPQMQFHQVNCGTEMLTKRDAWFVTTQEVRLVHTERLAAHVHSGESCV